MRTAVWIAAAVLLALSVAADFLVGKEAGGPWWAHRGFFAWFGFVGCVVIVVGSKLLGRWLLERPEDYYERGPDDG